MPTSDQTMTISRLQQRIQDGFRLMNERRDALKRAEDALKEAQFQYNKVQQRLEAATTSSSEAIRELRAVYRAILGPIPEEQTAAPWPHCDDLVLHAPKICAYCDHYPHHQQQRIATGVCFTGEKPEAGKICREAWECWTQRRSLSAS